MDSIKTHCYATFGGMAAAERAIAALQDLQWPVQSFKRLEAKMGDISAEEVGGAFLRVTTHRLCMYSCAHRTYVCPERAAPGVLGLNYMELLWDTFFSRRARV